MMNERMKELAEQAAHQSPDGYPVVLPYNEHFVERFAELIRTDEHKVIDGIFDQAFKDQKDAERYMHLKHILKTKGMREVLESKTDSEIDIFLDELIRSYDD